MDRRLICTVGLFFSGMMISAQAQTAERPSGPIDGIRIAWDYSSLQQLAPQEGRNLSYAGYPRIKRLDNGDIAVVYEAGGNGEFILSSNNGKTWTQPAVTFKRHVYTNGKGESVDVRIANTELIQLQNGDLLLACNYRPVKEEIAPYAIAVKRSRDMGKTWLDDQVLYEAHPRFGDGCWEPAMLQLPGGELQVYFANEAPYTGSHEQEISMISSKDNGYTWSKDIKTVSFRKDRRDGMPVPLLVNDEILVAIEDNMIEPFKPYIVRSHLSDNWFVPVLKDSPNREYALKEKLKDDEYGGAPYLCKLPTGEVLLSYQTTRGRTPEWELSTMEVAIGDKTGRNFGKVTRPFHVSLEKQAKWNSISNWDERTVVAVSATNCNTKNIGASMILGYIIPELSLSSGLVYKENFPLFVGHKGNTNLSASITADDYALYVFAKVKDGFIYSNPADKDKTDGVTLYIDTGNSLTTTDTGLFKIESDYRGNIKTSIPDIRVESDLNLSEGYYTLEFQIPLKSIQKRDRNPFRINLELSDASEDTFYKESVVHADPDASDTWVKVSF